MSTPMTAGQLLAELERWGIRYVTAPGWSTRNRNAYGPWGPVHGILLHHTGDDAPDDADQRVLTNGRSDLPGPLCHWGMRDDGTVVLIGWGRANHAGKGAANVLDALLTEDYGTYPPAPGPDTVDGNQLLYGQETMYSGLHAPTDAAYAATVRMFAAVCEFHGWSGKSCIGHKEWTSRKPDPGHLDMAQFRRDVDAALRSGPGTSPAPTTTDTPSTASLEGGMFIGGSGGRLWLYRSDGQKDYLADGTDAAWLRDEGKIPYSSKAVPAGVDALFTFSGTQATREDQLGRAVTQIQAGVAALAAARPDVDEQALAAALAPLLQEGDLDTETIADRLVTALPGPVAAELARRLAQ